MRVRVVEYAEWKYSNRPGALARFAGEFSQRGVDLQALWAGPQGRRPPIPRPAGRSSQNPSLHGFLTCPEKPTNFDTLDAAGALDERRGR